jgi:hypothetical protein
VTGPQRTGPALRPVGSRGEGSVRGIAGMAPDDRDPVRPGVAEDGMVSGALSVPVDEVTANRTSVVSRYTPAASPAAKPDAVIVIVVGGPAVGESVSPGVTVKLPVLVTLPAAVVTSIRPLLAAAGTSTCKRPASTIVA